MKKTPRLALTLSMCCANMLYAAELTPLSEVTVRELNEDTGSNRSINMDQIEKTQAKDLKDVLRRESSVSVSGGGSQGTQKIFLRGIESTNLSVTLDGASQGVNMSQHRSNMSGIDADLLKAVDVKTSPSAENKGALGGSITMTTKDAQDLVQSGEKMGAIIRAGISTAYDEKQGSTTLYGIADKYFGLYANIAAQNGGNYNAGADGEEVLGTAQKDRDYFFKFSMLDYNDHSLKASIGRHTRSGLVEDDKGAPATPTAEAARALNDLTRDTITLEHHYNPSSPYIDISTNIYKNSTEEETTNRTTGVTTANTREDIGGKIKNTIKADFLGIQNTFLLGMDYSKEEGSTTGKSITSLAKNIGFFTQNTTNIGPVAINYGARVDQYDTTFGPQTLSGTETSPNIGIDYQIIDSLSLFANYGEAVRASGVIPISWMTNMGVSSWTYNQIKPETSTQKEIGIRFSSNSMLKENDSTKITLTAFDTTIENLITQVGGQMGTPVTAIINDTLPIETKGFELKASWEDEKLFTSLGFTKADTKRGDDVYKASVGNRRGAASGDRLTWYMNYQVLPSFSYGYNLTAVDKLEYSDGTSKPGYAVHDLHAQWDIPQIKGMTLNMAINNLTNKTYIEHTTSSATFTEPGRDYRVSMKYQF